MNNHLSSRDLTFPEMKAWLRRAVARAGTGHDDYSLKRVPDTAKKPWWHTAVLRFAQLLAPSQFMLGAALGTGMSFGRAVLAITIGLLILETITILMGVIGVRESLTTVMLARWTGFGRAGSFLVGITIAATSAGWFGFQDSFLAQGLARSVGGLPQWAWCLIGGAVVIAIAAAGFEAMTKTAGVAAILFLPLITYTVLHATSGHSFRHLVAAAPAGPAQGLGAGITVVVGGFIAGAVVTPDLARFNRRPADVIRQAALGITAGEYVSCIAGVLLARAAQTQGIVSIVVGASGVTGAIVIAVVVVLVNSGNLYGGSFAAVGTANAVRPERRLDRTRATVVAGVIGSVLAAVGIINVFVPLLKVLGTTVPPVAGIMIAEYFVVRTWRGPLDASREGGLPPDHSPGVVPAGLTVWAISAAVGLWVHVGIPALNSVLLAFLLYAAAGLGQKCRAGHRTSQA